MDRHSRDSGSAMRLSASLDGEAGPAMVVSDAAMDAQVLDIVTRFEAGVEGSPSSHKGVRKTGVFLVAMVALAGSAAAMIAVGALDRQAPPTSETGPVAQGPSARGATLVATPQPASANFGADAPVLDNPAAAEVPRTPSVQPAPDAVPPPRQEVAPIERRLQPIADLMAAANRHRGAGRYRAALAAYRTLLDQKAHGPTAHVAAAAAAAIELERLHRPTRAARLYKHALRADPHGALRVECLAGLANVYRALGDVAAERKALSGVLEAGQQGPVIRRAQQRLDEIAAGGSGGVR